MAHLIETMAYAGQTLGMNLATLCLPNKASMSGHKLQAWTGAFKKRQCDIWPLTAIQVLADSTEPKSSMNRKCCTAAIPSTTLRRGQSL
jgi:hypothetical protein